MHFLPSTDSTWPIHSKTFRLKKKKKNELRIQIDNNWHELYFDFAVINFSLICKLMSWRN